jgi:Recombination enhancement, RecA-dependent nuclease
MTNDEKKYLSRVAELGCFICNKMGYPDSPCEIHHRRSGVGKAQRASNYEVVGLCPEHHRGRTGIHGMGLRAFEREYKMTEIEMVEQVRLALSK